MINMHTLKQSLPDQYLQLADTERNEFISRALKETLPLIDTDPSAMLDSLFLNAINDHQNISADKQDHIYLKQYEIPQIVLFDILINKLPFVVNAHAITNKAIVRSLAGIKKAVLVDAGIGRGLQTVSLIKLLQHSSVEDLTIIGIELGAEAIAAATEEIKTAASGSAFRIDFIPIVSLIEELNAAVLKGAIPADKERLIVNSSLTIHHIPTRALRKAFFQLAKDIGADHVFLTEPDSDHFTNDWAQRLRNAYAHYQAVFEVIDQLDITSQEKNGLKLFFGREIDDVVGNAEDQRFEKHEPGGHWVDYLAEAGFRPARFEEVPADIQKPGVQFVLEEKGLLSIRHSGVGVLALVHGVSGI